MRMMSYLSKALLLFVMTSSQFFALHLDAQSLPKVPAESAAYRSEVDAAIDDLILMELVSELNGEGGSKQPDPCARNKRNNPLTMDTSGRCPLRLCVEADDISSVRLRCLPQLGRSGCEMCQAQCIKRTRQPWEEPARPYVDYQLICQASQ